MSFKIVMEFYLKLFFENQVKTFLNSVFFKTKRPNETIHIAGDFNLNLLDHDTNTKIYNFLNLIELNGMIATINEPTKITRKAAATIDPYFH